MPESARAIIAQTMCCPGGCQERIATGKPCFAAAHWNDKANAIIAALSAAGMAVVPREATGAMTQAAHHALYQWREKQGDPQQDPTNERKHAIRWAAMLAAACPKPRDN